MFKYLAFLIVLQFGIPAFAIEPQVNFRYLGKDFTPALYSAENGETITFVDRSFRVRDYSFLNKKLQFGMSVEDQLTITEGEYIPVHSCSDLNQTIDTNIVSPEKWIDFVYHVLEGPVKKYGFDRHLQGGFVKVSSINEESVDLDFYLTIEQCNTRAKGGTGDRVCSCDGKSSYKALTGRLTAPKEDFNIVE